VGHLWDKVAPCRSKDRLAFSYRWGVAVDILLSSRSRGTGSRGDTPRRYLKGSTRALNSMRNLKKIATIILWLKSYVANPVIS